MSRGPSCGPDAGIWCVSRCVWGLISGEWAGGMNAWVALGEEGLRRRSLPFPSQPIDVSVLGGGLLSPPPPEGSFSFLHPHSPSASISARPISPGLHALSPVAASSRLSCWAWPPPWLSNLHVSLLRRLFCVARRPPALLPRLPRRPDTLPEAARGGWGAGASQTPRVEGDRGITPLFPAFTNEPAIFVSGLICLREQLGLLICHLPPCLP